MKETKDKIILKALQYFTENDFEGTSLDKIARASGITKGGIYHYFESKDELFKAIAALFQIDLLKDYFNYAYLMFVGIKKIPDLKIMVGGIYASMQEELTVILEALQAKGEVDSSLDCNAMAFELAAMMEGAMLIVGFDSKLDMKGLGIKMADNIEKRIAAK